ncbi:chemotaxis protein CheW [Aliiglaciecola sp. CAU 1673]|uniref:chemotaxis protein CheW n=1 Tax=Aliiglaciecola sp. CAU 1673 TaxID=3032595 RepID=UPI0023DA239A|nr:chemotaxis protein CheW [Aliiglaciecola sp. CAU 1673]MDF2178241.1 chemotaxis protein CheW [Aliiglaciecola sp. CAU 1673]
MNQSSSNQDGAALQSIQILSFVLDGDWFGVEIGGIQEVLEYRTVTKVPRTPAFMLGVINLRGKVIPVVDLRRHFEMKTPEPTVDSCIIIIHVEIDGESTALGILADRVKEVLEIDMSNISPPPKIGSRVNSNFIYGMARHDDNFIILLRLARVFSSEELQRVMEQTETLPQPEVSSENQGE